MDPTRGNNSLSAKYSYVQREIYEEEVDKLLQENPQLSLIDLRAKPLYGKLSLDNKIIVPRQETLVAYDGVANVLPFVADALEDLSARIQSRTNAGTMRRSGPYQALLVTARDESWKDEYVRYLSSLKDAYLSELRADPLRMNSLVDFKKFVQDFINFTTIANPRFPTSFSKFYTSGLSNVFSSGCVVDLNSEEYGDDYISTVKYFSDVNFKTFAQEAQNHGFILDRHAPWRLVANLKSEPMRKYMQAAGYANMKDSFDNLYFSPFTAEFYEIVKLINFMYTEIFTSGSTYADVCYKNGKTTYSLKPREIFDPSHFNSLEEMINYLGYPFWLRAYGFLKAREINKDLTQREFDDRIQEAVTINKHVDTAAALGYINDKFNPLEQSSLDKKPSFVF
tara:strand:- start:779 stop:1963 length:1185 start_codon:yes stop_codon:yes gene_type:complete